MNRLIPTPSRPRRVHRAVTRYGWAVLIAAIVLSGSARYAAATEARVGAPAPDFTLKDTNGRTWHLSDSTKEGKVVVLEWFNPDCPFVRKYHASHKAMVELAAAYTKQGVVWVAVNSGAPGKQGNGLERNRKAIEDYGIAYPVLLDESGEVGKTYRAKTTPHMFLIDAKGILRYEGAIDNEPNTTKIGDVNYLKNALDAVLSGGTVQVPETRSYGCSVKYAG